MQAVMTRGREHRFSGEVLSRKSLCGPDILDRQRRVVGDDLLGCLAGREAQQDMLDGDARLAITGLPNMILAFETMRSFLRASLLESGATSHRIQALVCREIHPTPATS